MHNTESASQLFFHGLTKPTSFFILRHGETTANAEKRIQGLSEYPLNENGRKQAAGLAEYLRGKELRRLFHSPLSRAAETARIVAVSLGMEDAEAEPLLVELDTGSFSGLTLAEIEERYPEVYKNFWHQSWEAVPDAERTSRLYERALGAWAALKAAAIEAGGNVAAISHGGTIQWLVRATFGCRTWMPLLPTGNCGVFELYVEPTGADTPPFMQWKEINLLPTPAGSRVPQVF
jgi:broad specificity phosphatase PhoE